MFYKYWNVLLLNNEDFLCSLTIWPTSPIIFRDSFVLGTYSNWSFYKISKDLDTGESVQKLSDESKDSCTLKKTGWLKVTKWEK